MTGARGPKSKPGAIRRNKPRAVKTLEGSAVEAPDLAEWFPAIEFLPQTLGWWRGWIESPQTAFFAATDWLTLVRLAPLVDAYWTNPTAQALAEIRQTEAKLGGTVADRDRLGWSIEEPLSEGEAEARPAGSRAKPDPRKGAN